MAVHEGLAAIGRATAWLNCEPLTADGLGGHVVLVDFWTYSCVNWLRTLPYLTAWDARYREYGLVTIGVHAPEFGFEHELENVRHAIDGFGIGYPVVIDNDFSIWRSFDNHYWPAVYLVDQAGRAGYHHFGEEAYEETERAIQRLLGLDPLERAAVRVDADGLCAAAKWDTLKSPETYLGYARGERRVDGQGNLALNEWALQGDWSVGDESAALDKAPGSIAYRFEGRDVNLVMAPAATGEPVGFSVRLDGRPPSADHGLDVDESGAGVLVEPRMYQLVRQREPIRQQTFEITFAGPGAAAYVFTFG